MHKYKIENLSSMQLPDKFLCRSALRLMMSHTCLSLSRYVIKYSINQNMLVIIKDWLI